MSVIGTITPLSSHGPIVQYGEYEFEASSITVRTSANYGKDGVTLISSTYEVSVNAHITGSTEEVFATDFANVQIILQTRGLRFTVKSNGNTLLDAIPRDMDTTFVDVDAVSQYYCVDRGPQPLDLRVDRITPLSASIDWRLRYTVKMCNNDANLATHQSISKKPVQKFSEFSTTENFAIDHRGRTVRIIRGFARLLPKVGQFNADALRSYLVPDALTGWKRTQTWQVSADRLTIQYTITDVEQYTAPPAEFVDAQLFWSVHASGIADTKPVGVLEGFIEGKKSTKKKDIIKAILDMANVRFNPLSKDKVIWIERSIRDVILENRIEFKFTASLPNIVKKLTTKGLETIGKFPASWGKGVTYVSGPYGEVPTISSEFNEWEACAKAITRGKTKIDNTKPKVIGKQTLPDEGTVSGSSADLQKDENAPYLDVSEIVSYSTRTNKSVAVTLSINNKDVVQQHAHPETWIMISGSRTRLGKPPLIPKPPENAVLEFEEISPHSTSNSINGTIYSVAYKYKLKVADTFNGDIKFPEDPRIRGSKPLSVPGVPRATK